MTPAASLFDWILALHIMAVVVAFGVTFAYPIMFAVAARSDPRSLPLMHRIEHTVERLLLNPGLLVVILAGIYLASKGHYWSQFFVQWGLAAAIVIGGLVGGVMIPTGKRAEAAAGRAPGGGGPPARPPPAAGGGDVQLDGEYQALVRRLTLVGSLLSGLVLVTILFMAVQP
jgi:uncharacterized membrane protein